MNVVLIQIRYLLPGQRSDDEETCDSVHIASNFEKAEQWITKNTDWMEDTEFSVAWWAVQEYEVDKDLGKELRYYQLNGKRIQDLHEIKKNVSWN